MEVDRKAETKCDTTAAQRAVWLIKVPKALGEAWDLAAPGEDIGQLQLYEWVTLVMVHPKHLCG